LPSEIGMLSMLGECDISIDSFHVALLLLYLTACHLCTLGDLAVQDLVLTGTIPTEVGSLTNAGTFHRELSQ